MGKTEANVKQGNKIYIVDPNPPEMEKHSPEDMFLYIKFKANNRNRSTYLGKDETTQTDQFTNTGTEGEINFIATQVNFNADGQITPDPQQTYATTSYTNIGGIQESNSRGTLEGFGIKNIDIKYNASLVPTVDMTFTDVRGAALFDVTEQNTRKSPYSIFFKMPYPIFTLSVKGYFGKTVDYCLHMINWTSNFDGTTGNFDISANFVGFQQAFLADMVLGNIIGVVNTSAGYNKLMGVYAEERKKFDLGQENKKVKLTLQEIGSDVPFADVESGKKLNIRKIDDFFVRISKLQIETESIKRDSKELEKLKTINKQLSKLKNLQQFIGTSIIKKIITQNQNESSEDFDIRKESKPFDERDNNPEIIKTSIIKDNVLKEGKNYLSIRDYIIFNTINVVAMERWFTTLTTIMNDYRDFVNEASTEPLTPINLSVEKTFQSDYIRNGLDEIVYTKFIDDKVTNKKDPVKLDEVFTVFQANNDNNPLNKFYVKNPNPNADFPVDPNSPFTIAATDNPGRDKWKQDLNLENLVKALNFTKIRPKLQMKINELEKEAEKQYEEAEKDINEKLNKQLDFSPKVKDVFRILCNNTDAMLQTLADITKEAEKPEKKQRRKDALSGCITDTPPDNKNSYAWPRIYKVNVKGDEEVYMGDIPKLVNNYPADFPEYHFVNEVFENLVARRKKLQEISAASNLKNGLDTDNWFPLNPVDYDENPFLLMNNLITSDALKEEFIKQLLIRSCLLTNYSLYNNNSGSENINDYANLDGISANKTIYSNTVRHMLIEILKHEVTNTYPGTEKSLIDIAIERKIIKEENGSYILLEEKRTVDDGVDDNGKPKVKEEGLPHIGGYPISGYRNPSVEYIIIDDATPIVNNGKKIKRQVTESISYKTITLDKSKPTRKPKEKEENYFKNDFYNNNYQSFLYCNVWIPPFDIRLSEESSEYEQFDIDNIANIDGGDNETHYINQLAPNPSPPSAISGFTGDTLLTTTNFYKGQVNVEAKAILLLSTFPFRAFEDGVLTTLRDNNNLYNGARILNLPSHYLYFIGGLLYREDKAKGDPAKDPIKWPGIYSKLKTNTNEYLSKLGVIGSLYSATNKLSKPKIIEEALTKLPQQTKDNLINYFTNWADSSGFTILEKLVREYTEDPLNFETVTSEAVEAFKKIAASKLIVQIQNKTPMVVFAPEIFNPQGLKGGLSITKVAFDGYLNNFKTKFENANTTNTNNNKQAENNKKDNKSNNQAKLQIYNYFKNINDKWVASSNGKSYNACSGQGTSTSLIDYFKFLNRGWKDIGNEAVINLNSLLTLGNNLDTNMYFYISKVLRDSNFLFQILPTFIDYKNPQEVKDMFKPVTVVSDSNEKRGPIYTCIYVGSSSQSLDIGDTNDYYYSNDGFTFTNNVSSSENSKENTIPGDFNLGADEEREFALVAFRVGFGGENQGIFKSVSLSQQEHRETGEYFQALGDLVDKRGGTQRSYQGTDLLRLFKTRSYTCKVEALGCMNIQPLMYFDLQNVPFFHGAYLITSVSHNITPNHMTTSFQGLRISRYNSSPVTDVTAYLDIDLNEGSNDPLIPFTNLDISDSMYTIGVKDPDDTNWESRLTATALKDIGVNENIATEGNVEYFKLVMKREGILSNAQAMMFLSIALTQSDYFKYKEETWAADDNNLKNCIVYSSITNTNFGVITNNVEDIHPRIFVKVGNPPEPVPLTYKNGDNVHWVLCTSKNYNKTHYSEVLFNGKGPGGTEQQHSLWNKYGNSEAGDAYRYRPRGYISIVGKGQYEEAFSGATFGKYNLDPNLISSQSNNAFEVGALVWSKKWVDKPQSFNDFVGVNGTATMYSAVAESQTWNKKSIQDYFIVFEKVLSMCDLLEYGSI